ncbi:MAG: hypothetical protein MJZ23_08815 [Paludibacteraceae bacterium]|nr:hypothetical protein [Paludibacteraceae bacterium]
MVTVEIKILPREADAPAVYTKELTEEGFDMLRNTKEEDRAGLLQSFLNIEVPSEATIALRAITETDNE